MRTVAYARFSSDKQREASLTDQLRNCREWCQRNKLPAPSQFTDAGISGARSDRPQYRALLGALEAGEFDILLVDDLSRLSRDHIECARVLRRLACANIRVVGVSDGVDTAREGAKLAAGMRGLMNELYLDDLAKKVHRGQTGRVLAGYAASAPPYGYIRIRKNDNTRFVPDPERADVVREIYTRYAAGEAPAAIASDLNARRIPAPRGQYWSRSSLGPDMRRGIGILANPLYAGRMIWNRSRFVKDPDTGKRIRRERPRAEWITHEDEGLRIIPQALWRACQARAHTQSHEHLGARRGKYLFSGLLKCGECGSAYVIVDRYRYGCGRHKTCGDSACSNSACVSRAIIESTLLAGIRQELAAESAYRAFESEARRLLKEFRPDLDAAGRAVAAAERERDNLLAALRAGILTPSVRADLERAEHQLEEARAAQQTLSEFEPAKILPRAREIWRDLVANLENIEDTDRAREALRGVLGDKITINADGRELVAEFTPAIAALQSQISVVAGASYAANLTSTRISLGIIAHAKSAGSARRKGE